MPKYDVYRYESVRIAGRGIEAESPEEAAKKSGEQLDPGEFFNTLCTPPDGERGNVEWDETTYFVVTPHNDENPDNEVMLNTDFTRSAS